MSARLSPFLLDLDGTLLDTPTAVAAALCAAVEEVHGSSPPHAEARALIGLPLEELLAQLLHSSGDPAAADTTQRCRDAYLRIFRETIIPRAAELELPGVMATLGELREQGRPVAVVTSKYAASARQILEAAGMDGLVDVVVGADDTEAGKPAADPALHALDLLGCPPGGGVVIGDAVADVQMGSAAGLRSIGVTTGVASGADLLEAGADAVCDSFAKAVHTARVLSDSETTHEPRSLA